MSQNQNKKANKGSNELIVIKNRPRTKIGKEYQAVIPDLQPAPQPNKDNESQSSQSTRSSQSTDYETLLWDCNILPEEDVKAYEHKDRGDHIFCSSQGRPTRDDEEALTVLHNYGYDIKKAEEARARIKMTNGNVSWSDEEKKLFEAGFTEFGKNFAAIKEKYLQGRSEKEIINFYYKFKISKSSRSFLVKLESEKRRLRSSSGKMYHNDEFIYY